MESKSSKSQLFSCPSICGWLYQWSWWVFHIYLRLQEGKVKLTSTTCCFRRSLATTRGLFSMWGLLVESCTSGNSHTTLHSIMHQTLSAQTWFCLCAYIYICVCVRKYIYIVYRVFDTLHSPWHAYNERMYSVKIPQTESWTINRTPATPTQPIDPDIAVRKREPRFLGWPPPHIYC
jgi:hypothetical protein